MKTARDTGNFHRILPIEKFFACICTFSQPRFPLTFAGRKDAHSSSHFFTTGGHRRPIELGPTKLSMVTLGFWSDQPDVPVLSEMAKG